MVLPDYIRRAALGGGPTDLKMIKDWLESGGDINDVDADGETLALRGRAKPDSLLASVVRLPNELAWHVLTFWPAEADTSSLS